MNPPSSVSSLSDRLRFVLVETSHPGNVGAAARAMRTMGFFELVLVSPRYENVLTHEEAVAFASGATDVLARARVVSSLDQALEGCNFCVALSARLREFSPPVHQPRTLAKQLQADTSLRTALVFGSERYGLSNEQVEKCHALVNVPTDPTYGSLNLAQAVQILAYECRMDALGDLSLTGQISEVGFQGERASAEQVEGMFVHLEKALVEMDFLDPHNPKKLMPRLRRLFARASLETEEVNILRGIAGQIITHRKRRG